MKSMLHEASSIIKAIEKAWNDSGQPSEFTIKVLETGEKRFLWFSKKPSIVSITYDPKKQVQAKPTTDRKMQQPSTTKQQHTPLRQQKPVHQNQNTRYPHNDQQQPQKQQRFQAKESPVKTSWESKETTSAILPKKQIENQLLGWTPEFTNQIVEHLKELVSILKLDTTITTKTDNKTLFITFSKKLAPTNEDEKMLFISISYLLMQFLKKKFKKKLKNFHLVLTSKESSAHDKTQSGASE